SDTLVGDIVGFEDGIYAIQTKGAEVQVTVGAVDRIEQIPREVIGPAASGPAATASAAAISGALRIAAPATLGEELIPTLVDTFARKVGVEDGRWRKSRASEAQSFHGSIKSSGSVEIRVKHSGVASAAETLMDQSADISM